MTAIGKVADKYQDRFMSGYSDSDIGIFGRGDAPEGNVTETEGIDVIDDESSWGNKAYVMKMSDNGTYAKVYSYVYGDEEYWIKRDELVPRAAEKFDDTYIRQYWYAKGFDTVTFDTGGYTGAWGPEGRIAMLH